MAGKDYEFSSGSPIQDGNMIEMADIDVHEQPNDIEKGISTRFRSPSLHLLSESYFNICVPLKNAALRGDIEEARCLLKLNHHQSVLFAAITENHETVLHVVTGARHVGFVQEIIKLMEPVDLMLQDKNGNTAFCVAAMVGSLQIAKIMLEKNASLLTIRGGQQMTPLYLAALFGHGDMAKFLYAVTKKNLTADDRKATFLISVHMGLYDFALTMFEDDKELVVARAPQGTSLHMLAQTPSAFASRSPGPWKRLVNWFPGMKFAQDADLTSTQALKLVQCLWRETLKLQDVDVLELIRNPSNLLFDAAELGNFEFLAVLIHSYPDLVHETDENHRTIFHIAVLNGHTNVLNLLHEFGFAKELLMTYLDKDQNSILHLAAKYRNRSTVSGVSDAALEMQRELLKFKDVEMIIKPSFKEKKNSEGKTPRELFITEHEELLKSAKSSTKKTASSCMILASIITIVMFHQLSQFNLPGGNDDEIGRSINIRDTLYQVFSVANAAALFCSSISMLIFLSIFTSHYAEDDFLKLIPLKSMTGLSALFMSIITMLIAFSSIFFISYCNYNV
ncbi:hypothetical protein Pint_21546 [Pistacia integerrima]|uniref:Uncharacterized protein n=1 Tax=Pistacia integerrima TaxID=434235 RepID=A0ACC0XBJ7_9ROSI|nr:hypothetical protein Pint_21546 [Pistacia integerrima]